MPGWLTSFTRLYIDKSFKEIFVADIKIWLRNTRGQSRKWWMIRSLDDLYLTYSRILVVFYCCYTWICHLDLSTLYLIASCDGCHARGRRRLLNPEHLFVLLSEPISHTSIQYMDFVEIFNVSLDLSTIYFIFLIFLGVELPLCIVAIVVTLS